MERIDYPEKPDCPFCRIVEGGDFIADNSLAVAFYDAYPLNEGHALIIPRRHQAGLFDLSQHERQALFSLLDDVQRVVSERHPAHGYNVGVNVGVAGGQTVPHVHLHLIPRLHPDTDPLGDGSFDPRGGVRWVIPENAVYWDEES